MSARATRLLARVGILAERLWSARRIQRNLEARARLARFRVWGWILAAVAVLYGLRIRLLAWSVDRQRRAIRAGVLALEDSHRPGRRAAYRQSQKGGQRGPL